MFVSKIWSDLWGWQSLVVEVGEVGQDEATDGAGETGGVPTLPTSGLLSEDHIGAWVEQSEDLQVRESEFADARSLLP